MKSRFGIEGFDYPDLSPCIVPEKPKNVPDGYIAVQGYDYFGFPEWVCVKEEEVKQVKETGV